MGGLCYPGPLPAKAPGIPDPPSNQMITEPRNSDDRRPQGTHRQRLEAPKATASPLAAPPKQQQGASTAATAPAATVSPSPCLP